MLPLRDLFRNKEIEINIDLRELKSLFETFKLRHTRTDYIQLTKVSATPFFPALPVRPIRWT